MARVLRMSDHPAEGTVQPESGSNDDDFSPIWADEDRPRIPRVAAEREALGAYLEYYRATVEMKCRGLTPEQARNRSMPPSTLSLHGVVRHLAAVERWWFQQNFERRDVPFLFFTPNDPDLDFNPPSDADFAADWRYGVRSVWSPARSSPLTTSGLVRGPRSALAAAPDDYRVRPALRARRSASRGGQREDRRMSRCGWATSLRDQG